MALQGNAVHGGIFNLPPYVLRVFRVPAAVVVIRLPTKLPWEHKNIPHALPIHFP